MGCFVSTTRASTSPREDHAEVAQPPKPPPERSIAPSHHASEELETVKEVLSETPKRNPIITTSATTKSQPQKPHQNKALHNFKEQEQEESKEDEKKALLKVTQEEETSEVSEEDCSLMSDTMSISTTEQREREESQETRKRVDGSPTKPRKNRSFSGDHGTKREKKLHASRNIGVGSQRRDQVVANQRMVNWGTRNHPRLRDPGETSFRRAGDGAAGRSVVGRCPSARRTNGSTGTAVPETGCRKMEVPVRESKWDYGSNIETLENPLVSLECFIFI